MQMSTKEHKRALAFMASVASNPSLLRFFFYFFIVTLPPLRFYFHHCLRAEKPQADAFAFELLTSLIYSGSACRGNAFACGALCVKSGIEL